VDMDFLTGRSDRSTYNEEHRTQNRIKIPVLGNIPAGIPFEAIETIIDYEEAPISWTKGGKEYFGLKVKGDSMAPNYLHDDIVLFLKTNEFRNGDDCAVLVNGYDAVFKRIKKQEDGIMLLPINTNEHDPVFYNSDDIERLPVTILGKAKEIRRTVK